LATPTAAHSQSWTHVKSQVAPECKSNSWQVNLPKRTQGDFADTMCRLRERKTGQQAGSDETQYVAHKHRLKTREIKRKTRNREQERGARKAIETHSRYKRIHQNAINGEKKLPPQRARPGSEFTVTPCVREVVLLPSLGSLTRNSAMIHRWLGNRNR
jgi:hypothetical protein